LVPRAAEAAGTGSTLHAQARIVALALDHCELKRLADDDRIAAKEIQERLLRSSFPTVQGLDIAHRYRSALAASGDFYCLSRPDASSLIVAVGDVAGKGIAAALMAAHINAELQYMNARASDNIGAHIASLNRVVCQASLPGSYLSLFYGLINLDRCTMRYVNAGHQPLPLHIRRRSGAVPFALDAGGPPVGLFRIPPEPYEVGEVVFQSGDVLLVATDGVTDAENPAGDAWGTDAFTRTAQILAGSGCIAEKVVGQIVEAIDLHCAGEPQGDDITVVCIKFE